MKPVHILGLLVVSGALGAVAGGVVGTLSGRPDSGADATLLARLDEVAGSVDALRESALDLRDDVADVRERIVAVELAMADRRAARAARAPEGADMQAAVEAEQEALAAKAASDALREAIHRGTIDLAHLDADAKARRERMVKGLKIRSMPEEERWQYAADTLRLNSVQVDEIKAAHAELQEGLKEAVVEERSETGDGGLMTFRRVDGNRMREAQEAFQARVDNALDTEQKKAWRDEGFDTAFGRRGGMPAFRIAGASAERVDPAAPATRTIEVITTSD